MSNVCSEPDCSFAPVGYHSMCLMHNKQIRMKSMSRLGHIKQKLGSGWDAFTDSLKAEATSQKGTDTNTDGISVSLSFFVTQLRRAFSYAMSESDQLTIHKAFGAKSESQSVKMINLKPIL